MAWRFNDTPSESSEFVVRKRPFFLPLLIIFIVSFAILYGSGVALQNGGDPSIFLITIVVVLGALCWFTIAYTQRKHDLVLLAEFQNALFASAAGLGARFSIIAKQDGTIAYIDPGFQELFPDVEARRLQTVEQFFHATLMPESAAQSISRAISEGGSERCAIEIKLPADKTIKAMISCDSLTKPDGYFLIRGREYIERSVPDIIPIRNVPKAGSAVQSAIQSPKKLSEEFDYSERISCFIDDAPVAIALLDSKLIVARCNEPFRTLTHHTRHRNDGWKFLDAIAEKDIEHVQQHLQSISTRPQAQAPIEMHIREGSAKNVALFAALFNQPNEEDIQYVLFLFDQTEQKNLEERYAHSQKMQAVGQLAGGVAHDFNNLLTAMIGFCDLLLIRHPAGDQSFADIMQIKQNANRAANLVRQLLAFSRRQTLQPKMLDLTDVLAELSNLVRRLIGENIELNMIHGRDIGYVKADQGQLEQVLINLAVNARDAMAGNGGTLSISTSVVTISNPPQLAPELIPPSDEETIEAGEYILVKVADSGHGIPREKIQQIFEPFFSTKELGAGTGLGLATVYGIIKQTGGYVYVQSEEGIGTSFHLYFPRYVEDLQAAKEVSAPEPEAVGDLTGMETILLVEDEAPVRSFAARALRNKGYEVLEADCGEAALEIIKEHGEELHVIVTDVIMPGMNGPEMIKRIVPDYPNVKVIFISGYAEDAFADAFGDEMEFNFLPKPFTLKQLASKIKEVTQ